jgi:hypothetical protein
MKALVACCVLLCGCYRLGALIQPTGPSIEVAGSPSILHGLGGNTVLPVPLGVASGDMLLLSIEGDFGVGRFDGWVYDDDIAIMCASEHLIAFHRIATDADVGGSVDVSQVSSVHEVRAVLAAVSHVSELGSAFYQGFMPAVADVPLVVPVPPAQAGQDAWVQVVSINDSSKSLNISSNGTLVGVADTLYVFDVPLADPIPDSVAVTGHSDGCGFIRAQTLIGGP